MKITTLEVSGISHAIKGARNPMNSWNSSDSKYEFNPYSNGEYEFILGKNDLKLAQNLLKGTGEHYKFMRMIQVWADFDMPRYFWSEFDTYSFNTKNSCSTMHRLLHKTTTITKDLFLYNIEDEDVVEVIIKRLNDIRLEYLEEKEVKKRFKLIARAKRLLPEGFLQLRTVNTNYAEIRNIYIQRVFHPHKLKEEWVDCIGEWIKSLPYAKELILYGLDEVGDKK